MSIVLLHQVSEFPCLEHLGSRETSSVDTLQGGYSEMLVKGYLRPRPVVALLIASRPKKNQQEKIRLLVNLTGASRS